MRPLKNSGLSKPLTLCTIAASTPLSHEGALDLDAGERVVSMRALLQYYLFYGDTFKVECPTGSGNLMNLFEVSGEIANRLTRVFLRDQSGRRPAYGGAEKFQTDPHWRDHLLFYEYFHGDNGAGIGASYQTGWTGVVAKLIEIFGRVDSQALLEGGIAKSFGRAKEAKPAGDSRAARVSKSRKTPLQTAT